MHIRQEERQLDYGDMEMTAMMDWTEKLFDENEKIDLKFMGFFTYLMHTVSKSAWSIDGLPMPAGSREYSYKLLHEETGAGAYTKVKPWIARLKKAGLVRTIRTKGRCDNILIIEESLSKFSKTEKKENGSASESSESNGGNDGNDDKNGDDVILQNGEKTKDPLVMAMEGVANLFKTTNTILQNEETDVQSRREITGEVVQTLHNLNGILQERESLFSKMKKMRNGSDENEAPRARAVLRNNQKNNKYSSSYSPEDNREYEGKKEQKKQATSFQEALLLQNEQSEAGAGDPRFIQGYLAGMAAAKSGSPDSPCNKEQAAGSRLVPILPGQTMLAVQYPTTTKEVIEAAAIRGIAISEPAASRFLDYNTARGWCFGNTAIRDWRSVIKGFVEMDEKKQKQEEERNARFSNANGNSSGVRDCDLRGGHYVHDWDNDETFGGFDKILYPDGTIVDNPYAWRGDSQVR